MLQYRLNNNNRKKVESKAILFIGPEDRLGMWTHGSTDSQTKVRERNR